MSELEQPMSLEEMCLKLHAFLLRPASQKLALHVSPQPPRYPFGYLELVNCSDAEGPSSELTEGVPPSITLPGPQPALIERALQQCSSLVQVTAQRSTLSSSRHQARQAALCRMILAERASLEQVQSALQSAVIGYGVAVRKGALLQHILNRLQPRFAALRGEKDALEQEKDDLEQEKAALRLQRTALQQRLDLAGDNLYNAEQRAEDLATQVQDWRARLQVVQGQHDGLNGQVQTLQGQKTALTGRVEKLQGHHGHLTGRVLHLEEQNAALGEEAASLQQRLDATFLKEHQNVAAMQCIRMENVLRRKVADQEQQMADQAQELKAQEQHMREQGEQMKGQVQQVMDLEQQVAGLHSKLKEEQKGKAAAVKANEAVVEDLQRQHQTESAAQRSQIHGLQQCLSEKAEQHDKLIVEHNSSLEAHNAAVQDLTSQLSNGTSVNSRQKAELSTQEAQLQRLDGELSEQQGQVQQLQSLVSEKQFELQRLSAEKQSVIEDQQGMIRTLGDRLTSSQQEVSAALQEKASAAHAHSAAAQEYESQVAALGRRLREEQKGKAAAAETNEAVVQDLQGQLAEQRTKSGAESAAQRSQIDGVQQCLADKTQQHDRLAADHNNALQAHESAVHSLTVQLAEKQAVVEGKHALIGKLGDRLTASIEEVSAAQQEKASAAHAHSAAAQEYDSKIAVLDLRLKEEQKGKAAPAEAHKPAVQELTSQLSESTSVTMRQKAELSTKEVHLQRLDGKLSEQQTKMTQLQSSVSKDRSEVQRLTAQLEEKQSLVEGKQDVVESLGTRLTASIEEVSAVHKELASATHAHGTDAQDYECRSAASNTRLSQQDSAAGGQQERFDDLTQHLSETACEASDLGHQVDILESSRRVDDELDAEEVHPQLHHSESASSLQEVDSLSSELASSEQRQGTPKRDMTREEGRYKPPHMWPGCSPSDAAAAEQSYSGGAQDSEGNRGSGSSQLSGRLDRDMPLFRDPVSSSQGDQKHSYSHDLRQQQHDGRFDYDHDYEYPARRRGNLYTAHPSVQQQHGHETFGFDSEMGPPGFTAGPQSDEWGSDEPGLSSSPPASEQQQYKQEENDNCMRPPGYDSEMGPPGFPVGPKAMGGTPVASSSAAAFEQHDDGMRPPGFPATPNRSMGMVAAQSERQQQPHEEQDDPSTAAAQHMQRQDRRHGHRGKRSGRTAKMRQQGSAESTAAAGENGWDPSGWDADEWDVNEA